MKMTAFEAGDEGTHRPLGKVRVVSDLVQIMDVESLRTVFFLFRDDGPGRSEPQFFQEALHAFRGGADGTGDLFQQGVDLLQTVRYAALESRGGVFADGGVDLLLFVVGERVVLVHILLDKFFKLGIGFFLTLSLFRLFSKNRPLA